GFWLLAKAWPVLYAAQREQRVAMSGPYARIRHPQYVGFVLIMFGFLLQWPTLITLVMFPILLLVYARLARREESDSLAQFGPAYQDYMARTPAFIPRHRQAPPSVHQD
ncbi:MAG: isoprenylcysteine carboxyl methyltransferase, partial [Betaproteobacteria bacterium HGW-Betaproteobacteria-21]